MSKTLYKVIDSDAQGKLLHNLFSLNFLWVNMQYFYLSDEQPHTRTRAENSVRKGKNQKTKGEKRNGGNQRRRRPER